MKTSLFRTICAADRWRWRCCRRLRRCSRSSRTAPRLAAAGRRRTAPPATRRQPVAAGASQAAATPSATGVQPAPAAALPPARGCAAPPASDAAAHPPRAARQGAEIDGRGAARTVAVVDVPVGRHHRQGGDDRSCLCLAGDLDRLHRQDDRAVGGAGASCARRCARSAMRGRWRKRNSRSAPRTACCRHCSRPRCARRGCRPEFPATTASRNARPRALPKSCAPKARRIRLGMGLLATIGATSPFVGLFGTVWGIMNSFIGISKSQTTNLAVVAPGIAEALLATAFGLVAAIPAVIIYNHFARVTKGYLELVGRSSGAAARLLSRDLDRTHVSPAARIRARRSRRWRISIADSDLDDDDDFAETHEINVTPFIDVILVLLIIFMVAAPLSTVDLPIDLPSSTATPQKKPDKPTYVSIKPDLAVAIGENPVKRVDLVRSLDAMADCEQGSPHFPARRSRGALWRIDGRAGDPARRRLHQDQAGGAGGRSGRGRAAVGARQLQNLERCGRIEMPDLDTEQKPRGGCGFWRRWRALVLHVGCGALAFAHLRGRRRRRISGRARRSVGIELTSPRAEATDLPAGPGYRCVGRLAGARRAEGRGQGNRPAEGHADRNRRSGSGGDARPSPRSPRRTIPRSPRCRPRRRRNWWRRKPPRGRPSRAHGSRRAADGRATRASARTRRNWSRMGPPAQRLSQPSQALSRGREDQGGQGQGRLRARPSGSRLSIA